MGAKTTRIPRKDRPANTTGITRLPTLDEINPEAEPPGTFDRLVLLLTLDHEIQVVDLARLLAFTVGELGQAEDWLNYRRLHASDNIIRKKRLVQPDCCKGVLERPVSE